MVLFGFSIGRQIERIELAATCPDCGRLSLEIWMSKGPCPHCENKPSATEMID
jgi:hypothetical protein